jgi:hypothetical protein
VKVAGLGKRYEILFPDGTVVRGSLVGPAKEPEEIIRLAGRAWKSSAPGAEFGDIDYELHVEGAEGWLDVARPPPAAHVAV